ncbi:MAG: thiamine phosphate synthase [Pelovirga sp.]
MPLPALYLITDRHQIPSGKDFYGVLEELLAAGVRMIQLREKDLPADELYTMAKKVREMTLRHQGLLLINDRVDVALAVAADGVHLRRSSLPADEVRKLLGSTRLIGVSTHSEEEIAGAAQQGADFVTFGPVYFTRSKASFGFPKGLSDLQKACQSSPLPVYALGGINVTNTPATLVTGVHGIATISTLMAATNPAATCQKLLAALSR